MNQWYPLGKLKVDAAGEGVKAEFWCDRVCEDAGRLTILSVAGPSTQIKALRAFLVTSGKGGVAFSPPEESKRPGWTGVRVSQDGYLCPRPVRLHQHSWHLVAVEKNSGLMKNYSDSELWQWLRAHTTTPAIRDWVPQIKEKLVEAKLLRFLVGFNCEPAVISASDAEMDQIVSDLIRNGDVSIPRRSA